MNNIVKKPRILVFIPNYLPGYMSGGILRTIVNTVDWLSDHFEFWIVTRDRDLGSDEAYQNIDTDRWQRVDGAMVRYLPPHLLGTGYLTKLIGETPHELIHMNSFFDPVFTVKILLARRLGRLSSKPLILSPRGEFVDGPLKLKYAKKIVYITLSKLFGFYKGIIWHASSKHELQDFVNVLKVDAKDVRVALDLPSKVNLDSSASTLLSDCCLRIVFLSRLTREKNLDCALRILKKVTVNVIFDIYGPAEDGAYWAECNEILKELPENIKATYHGPVLPTEVAGIFNDYDLFFFPTRGENYGHVIAESVSVGTKVLISKNTPWLDLENEELGWDVDLQDEALFVKLIEDLGAKSLADRLNARIVVKQNAFKRLLDPKVVSDNRALFTETN
jgi:glycosyltransferase involved in cell wall biosynthesis